MEQVMLNVLYATRLITLTMTLGLLFGLFRIVDFDPSERLRGPLLVCVVGTCQRAFLIGRTDEIGMLGDSFNRMTRELSGYTTELQQRVEERTRELHEKNQQKEVNIQLGEAVKKLDELAKKDRLTNVFNRGHIIDLLEEGLDMASRRQTSYSILLFDVDHFKSFNDTHGHLVGDFVLKEGSSA